MLYSQGCFSFFLKEPDEFFEKEKLFLTEYNSKLSLATQKADRFTRTQKGLSGKSHFCFHYVYHKRVIALQITSSDYTSLLGQELTVSFSRI